MRTQQPNQDITSESEPEDNTPIEREKKLKDDALAQIDSKKSRSRKKNGKMSGANTEFDNMYGKEVDEFLNDSDWDVDSYVAPSARSQKSESS